jgi:hypothetical protein
MFRLVNVMTDTGGRACQRRESEYRALSCEVKIILEK